MGFERSLSLHCFSRLLCLLTLGAAMSSPAQAARLDVVLTDQEGEPVDDACVYIVSVDGAVPASQPAEVLVDQIDEAFVPHVRATTTGSRVSFPNSDHIRHHVYSFSEAHTFELPLYIGLPAEPVVFDTAGVVTLGCNIHDHMLGYILVLETPWFAEVSAGKASIEGLPAGELQVEVWHPRLANGVATRTLQATDAATATLSLQLELRPERMLRRAPRRSGSRY
jgi:plastocyanin